MTRDGTLSITESNATARGAPTLFVVATAGAPLSPARSSRHLLDELHEIEIARGPARRSSRSGGKLLLELPDGRLSAPHARLARDGGRWLLEDRGSKNGVFVNGARAARTLLADGDVLELGYSFFVYKEAAVAPDIEAAALPARPPGMASLSPALIAAFDELARAAPTALPVLIGGESGTGKELLARAVHALSRRPGPLVPVNCAALPRTLIESELFGFKKGSFSGALADKAGLIAASDRGTLFLDEIAELPPEAQASLLRVLQEREVLAIGAVKAQPVNLRVVAATHQPLHDGEQFRGDLLARLSGLSLRLPPLRERREDLGLLLASLAERHGRPSLQLSHASMRLLFLHHWPGNVRELERALEVALALGEGDTLTLRIDAPAPRTVPPMKDTDRQLRAQLETLLRQHEGNVAAVARELGKAREQVHRWLKRLGLDAGDFRA